MRYRGDFLVDGEKAWTVNASLPKVKAYYNKMLSRAGFVWGDPTTSTTGSGKVVAWHGTLASADSDGYGFFTIDATASRASR